MINMAGMLIYGKNLKSLLLWNQKTDDLESWYATSGTQVLPSLFKWSFNPVVIAVLIRLFTVFGIYMKQV